MPTSNDDFGPFRLTDDWAADWWTWIERLARVISDASVRVSAALISGGFAIAASNMFERQASLAKVTLGVAGGFAIWVVVSSVLSIPQRR
jgi:hypothetical protein